MALPEFQTASDKQNCFDIGMPVNKAKLKHTRQEILCMDPQTQQSTKPKDTREATMRSKKWPWFVWVLTTIPASISVQIGHESTISARTCCPTLETFSSSSTLSLAFPKVLHRSATTMTHPRNRSITFAHLIVLGTSCTTRTAQRLNCNCHTVGGPATSHLPSSLAGFVSRSVQEASAATESTSRRHALLWTMPLQVSRFRKECALPSGPLRTCRTLRCCDARHPTSRQPCLCAAPSRELETGLPLVCGTLTAVTSCIADHEERQQSAWHHCSP